MTFSITPFALQNATLSADALRQAVSSLVPPGGGVVTAGDLAVTQTGTPSMNVSIGVGRIWIPGTNVGNVSGGNFSSQAMYYGQNDAAFTASVTTSDPINPRIDVVYAAVTDSQYAGITNTGTLAVVAGVPTSGATYPANAPTIPSNAKAVAWITVPATASSIVNANITPILTPTLQPLPVMHAELTFNQTGINSATPFLIGTLTADSSATTDTNFVTSVASGVTFNSAGIYAIDVSGTFGTAGNGRSFMQIFNGATTIYKRQAGTGEDTYGVSIPNFRATAGQQVFFACYITLPSGTTTWTGRVRITRIR